MLDCMTAGGVIKRVDLDTEIKNRFEKYMKNYICFVDRKNGQPKSQWKISEDCAWFIDENRELIHLTTKPEPYTLQKALHWLHRQAAPTIKMV